MGHHTKDKGDTGVAHVIADLADHWIGVTLPLSEHAPFDLIAYTDDADLARVQVKYRTVKKGAMVVAFRGGWYNKDGFHTWRTDKTKIDVLAVYCPDSRRCYYLPPETFRERQTISIRVDPCRNNQRTGVRMAEEFTDPYVMFGPGKTR